MGTATSKSLAAVTLTLLPFDALTLSLRFYVRISRRAWGLDDWAMLIATPFFLVTTISMTALAWNGLGVSDAALVGEPMNKALFWYFISGTMFTFWVMTLKWSIGLTILRIAGGKRWVTWSIYISLTLITLTSGATGIFQFAQCTPMKAIWDHDTMANGGKCVNRSYLAILSTTLAAVSIATDWYMALIPIPLLWNIQMNHWIKLSVVGLLALGIFASIAGIIRFAVIVEETPKIATGLDYMIRLDPIMTWAQAEPAIGTIAANLPALRPLLGRLTNITSHNQPTNHRGLSSSGPNQYLELDKLQRSKKSMVVENKVYSGFTGEDEHSKNSHSGSESQTRFVSLDGGRIRVEREVEVTRE